MARDDGWSALFSTAFRQSSNELGARSRAHLAAKAMGDGLTLD